MRLYYAQNKEDLLIKSFFPDVENGIYFDIGANHPVIDSVTKIFYDSGWSGVNIEPIPRLYQQLSEERPLDTTLNIGIGSRSDKMLFTEYVDGDGLSTFDDTMVDYYGKGDHHFPTENVKQYTVKVKTLTQVVKELALQNIHFLKIDVEGYEYDVIKGYDWESIRPELICIESNHISKDWRPLLLNKRYHQVFFDGINNYYLAEESLFRKDYFSYENAVFAGNPVYYPAYVEITNHLEEKNNLVEEKLKHLEVTLQDREREILLLQMQQRDVKYLMKHLLKETQHRINNRAARKIANSGRLTYRADPQITKVINEPNDSVEELIGFIKIRDKANIKVSRSTIRDVFGSLFWRVSAVGMKVLLKSGKKIGRRVYGR